MNMTHRRQYSLKAGKDHKQIQQLISQFNQQLKISSSTQRDFNPNRTIGRLPILHQERSKPRSDRFLSEKMKYQYNLHTIITQIKDKMQGTRLAFKFSQSRSKLLNDSPNKSIGKNEFKIRSINLSLQQKPRQDLTKSYIQGMQKRLAQQKYKKRARYERFDFQPWGNLQQSEAVQIIQL